MRLCDFRFGLFTFTALSIENDELWEGAVKKAMWNFITKNTVQKEKSL